MERGLILSLVCILVVFAALCILSFLYSLIGKLFTHTGGWAHCPLAPKKKVARGQCATAPEDGGSEHGTESSKEELPEAKHDDESYRITFGEPDKAPVYGPRAFDSQPVTTMQATANHSAPSAKHHVATGPVDIDNESVDMSKATGAGAGSGAVTSPLPGVILNVCVTAGQAVKAGDKVAVLEAMKMENDITAEGSGTVKSINVKKGDSVLEGAVIITIG